MLLEIPDFHLLCSTVFTKPSSRAACDPEQAELFKVIDDPAKGSEDEALDGREETI